mgnify:FL=1
MENLRVVFVMICRFVGEQMSLIFTRRAQNSDVDKIVQILNDAISFLKESGSSQWQSGYPNRATVEDDIKNGCAWVLTVDNEVAGYAAVVIGRDSNYAKIDGEWNNDVDSYATIHRIAISSKFRGMHLTQFFLSNIISLTYAQEIHNFRIDTGEKNKIVQHIATSHNFIKRGIIQVDDPINPDRLAYELNIQ